MSYFRHWRKNELLTLPSGDSVWRTSVSSQFEGRLKKVEALATHKIKSENVKLAYFRHFQVLKSCSCDLYIDV